MRMLNSAGILTPSYHACALYKACKLPRRQAAPPRKASIWLLSYLRWGWQPWKNCRVYQTGPGECYPEVWRFIISQESLLRTLIIIKSGIILVYRETTHTHTHTHTRARARERERERERQRQRQRQRDTERDTERERDGGDRDRTPTKLPKWKPLYTSKRWVRQKMPKSIWEKKCTKIALSSFCVAHHCWSWRLPWIVINILRESPLEQTLFSFVNSSQLEIASWLGSCLFYLSALEPCLSLCALCKQS
jgi:hypothetical protein